jgi:hypothetical protein
LSENAPRPCLRPTLKTLKSRIQRDIWQCPQRKWYAFILSILLCFSRFQTKTLLLSDFAQRMSRYHSNELWWLNAWIIFCENRVVFLWNCAMNRIEDSRDWTRRGSATNSFLGTKLSTCSWEQFVQSVGNVKVRWRLSHLEPSCLSSPKFATAQNRRSCFLGPKFVHRLRCLFAHILNWYW